MFVRGVLRKLGSRDSPLPAPVYRSARAVGLAALRASYRTPRPVLPVRTDLPALLNRRGLTGCGVEVGVQSGVFSEHLLRHWRGSHLVSVDPWLAASAEEYVDTSNVSQEAHDDLYAETRRRLQPFGERSAVWRTTSVEAAERVLRGSLDFVYLDGRHDYDSVKLDLEAWYGRLRPGGVVAGHDYFDADPQTRYGVKSAVDEFFGVRGVRVGATFRDQPVVSWFAIVPGATRRTALPAGASAR